MDRSSHGLTLPDGLETDRLRLRPLATGDIADFVRFMTDGAATEHMLFTDEQKTPEGAREMAENVIRSYATDAPLFVLAAEEKATGVFVGISGLNAQDETQAELFFVLLPEFQGRGLGAEMAAAVVGHAFDALGLAALSASTAIDNAASVAVLEGLGFAATGPEDGLGTGWQVFRLDARGFRG